MPGFRDGLPHAEVLDDPGVACMLRYQGGDERAFDEIVEGFSPRVYALLTRFLGPVEGREDLVQEVFLRVVRARDGYRPEARFSTWLYRITFNLAANRSERRRAWRPLEGGIETAAHEWVDETVPAPAAALERDDLVLAVRAAVAALPERQRMALVLAKYEGLAYEDVAHVLETSEKAVKSMVHRAREALRERLSSFLGEEVA